MKSLFLATLVAAAPVAVAQTEPSLEIPARVKRLQNEVLRQIVSPDGVGSRLCSRDPALQAKCPEWKDQLLAIVRTEADWSKFEQNVERDLRFVADMLMNGWADDAAMQDAFIEELLVTPLMSLAQYAMARQTLNQLRTQPYELKVATLDGGEIDLAELRGKPVIVEFWAMGCVGCRRQLPKLKTLYRKYHEQGLQIVGLPGDKDQQKLKLFLAGEKITWPQSADRERSRADFDAFGFQWVSNVLLLDKEGRLLRMEPSFELQQWEELIRAELGLEALARS